MMAYNWPGNVREMENVLQQTLLLSPFVVILPENLPERFPQQKENKEEVDSARYFTAGNCGKG